MCVCGWVCGCRCGHGCVGVGVGVWVCACARHNEPLSAFNITCNMLKLHKFTPC